MALAIERYEYKRIGIYAPDVPQTSISFDWATFYALMAKMKAKSARQATGLVREHALRLHRAGHTGTLSNATRVAVLQALRS